MKSIPNYFAYIGIGQVSNQIESEKLAYDYMLQHAKEINDETAVKNLQKFDKYATDFPNLNYIMSVRSSLMNEYGIGFAHEETISIVDAAKLILFFKGYTLSEKVKYLKGMQFSQTGLWDYVVNDNLFESSTIFQIPVYITHGKYDYQVSYTLAREWFGKIEAPEKEFFTFENSAHGTIIEEPEKFVQIAREILLSTHKKVGTNE